MMEGDWFDHRSAISDLLLVSRFSSHESKQNVELDLIYAP